MAAADVYVSDIVFGDAEEFYRKSLRRFQTKDNLDPKSEMSDTEPVNLYIETERQSGKSTFVIRMVAETLLNTDIPESVSVGLVLRPYAIENDILGRIADEVNRLATERKTPDVFTDVVNNRRLVVIVGKRERVCHAHTGSSPLYYNEILFIDDAELIQSKRLWNWIEHRTETNHFHTIMLATHYDAYGNNNDTLDRITKPGEYSDSDLLPTFKVMMSHYADTKDRHTLIRGSDHVIE